MKSLICSDSHLIEDLYSVSFIFFNKFGINVDNNLYIFNKYII